MNQSTQTTHAARLRAALRDMAESLNDSRLAIFKFVPLYKKATLAEIREEFPLLRNDLPDHEADELDSRHDSLADVVYSFDESAQDAADAFYRAERLHRALNSDSCVDCEALEASEEWTDLVQQVQLSRQAAKRAALL